ncbi:hypothetical protein [Streptococcus danieliae]|uniref:Bacteriocin n=1 Tax=Streptococcus danieliae TaxID=747656 RepID=A0A7Z0M835_9STRE|nr:hypothetical protein [Streptococcus danieliae]MBF0700320.1 hypothetical protein [Streptococcus danieliae]NYS97496.1 hypothetical protein [Streptococcus danieliae]
MKKLVIIVSLLVTGLFIGVSDVEATIKVAPGAYCWNDANGHAKCGVNGSEVIAHTTRVVVNGWVNYGPWNPRPGIGVIW